MTFTLKNGEFENVHECWQEAPNSIVVLVGSTKRFPERGTVRITARENIRSGATPRYFAGYEEQVTFRDAEGNEQTVWTDADAVYPWQDGTSIDACLKAALGWVTE